MQAVGESGLPLEWVDFVDARLPDLSSNDRLTLMKEMSMQKITSARILAYGWDEGEIAENENLRALLPVRQEALHICNQRVGRDAEELSMQSGRGWRLRPPVESCSAFVKVREFGATPTGAPRSGVVLGPSRECATRQKENESKSAKLAQGLVALLLRLVSVSALWGTYVCLPSPSLHDKLSCA